MLHLIIVTVQEICNPLKEKLRNKDVALGVAVTIPCPEVAEALAHIGFDWLFIDMEHAPLELTDVKLILQAVAGTNTVPVVRVPWNDFVVIKRVLDLGVLNIIVPWMNSHKEAEEAVKACKYPPEGIRGCGPLRASLYGLKTKEYLEKANSEVAVIVQIETAKAVQNINEILSVKGVDATFVGPMDLSASLGYLGNPQHPEVKAAIEKIAKAHENTKVCPGIASSIEQLKEHLELGYRFINIGSDIGLITGGARKLLESAKNILKELT